MQSSMGSLRVGGSRPAAGLPPTQRIRARSMAWPQAQRVSTWHRATGSQEEPPAALEYQPNAAPLAFGVSHGVQSSDGGQDQEELLIARSFARRELGPRFDYTKEKVLELQLEVRWGPACRRLWLGGSHAPRLDPRGGVCIPRRASPPPPPAHGQVLKHNDVPRYDYGIEVSYRFADIDPWTR